MAVYQYKENKISNVMNIIGCIIPIILWFVIAFCVKDFTQLSNGIVVQKKLVIYFQLILAFLLLVVPMGNISRRMRQNSLKIVTNRKGLTVSGTAGVEKKFSWHELTNSVVIYGNIPFTKKKEMIPRKLILRKPQTQEQMQLGDIIEIDNNPFGMSFPDMEALIDEIRQNEPKIKQEVIGVENYCPHCKMKISNNLCKKCEGNIKMIPRWTKLFYTTKFSAVLFVILLSLTNSKILWISAGIIAILFVILPTFVAYKEDQRTRLNIKK